MAAKHVIEERELGDIAGELHLERDKLLPVESEALVLPAVANSSQMAFAAHSKELVKVLSTGGVSTRLYEDSREKRDLIRKSADIVLPVIAVVGEAALAIVCSVIGAWIYDRFLKRDKDAERGVRVEIMRVEPRTGAVTRHTIEGTAADVAKLLRNRLVEPEPELERAGSTARGAEGFLAYSAVEPTAAEAYESAKRGYREGIASLAVRDMRVAEKHFRDSVQHIYTAYLLDDRPAVLSRELHTIGRRIQRWFSCLLAFREGEYRQSCPVYLSHFVGGFSIGGTGTVICSICGKPMLDCEHVPGETYGNVVVDLTPGGLCTVCGKIGCAHKQGEICDSARAFGIVADVDPDHIAWVTRPEDPLCTICEVPVSKREIRRQLPPAEYAEFEYGKTPLYCVHCQACEG